MGEEASGRILYTLDLGQLSLWKACQQGASIVQTTAHEGVYERGTGTVGQHVTNATDPAMKARSPAYCVDVLFHVKMAVHERSYVAHRW
jgi:hypothetical protein